MTGLANPTRMWRYRNGDWREVPWPQRLQAAQSPVRLGDSFYIRSGFPAGTMSAAKRDSLVRAGLMPASPVVLRVGADGKVDKLDPNETLTVDHYRIALRCAMCNDCCGNFYASCDEAYQGKRKLRPGLLVCNLGRQGPLRPHPRRCAAGPCRVQKNPGRGGGGQAGVDRRRTVGHGEAGADRRGFPRRHSGSSRPPPTAPPLRRRAGRLRAACGPRAGLPVRRARCAEIPLRRNGPSRARRLLHRR